MVGSAILFLISVLLSKVNSDIKDIEAMTRTVGQSADFLWNASQIPIIGSQWGLRDPSGSNSPKPLFISIRINSNPSYGVDLDTVASSYKNRVRFIGNLSLGLAWFRIMNLKISDTNQYRATIQENGKISLPYTVSLTVQKEHVSTTTQDPSTPTAGNCSGLACTPAPTSSGSTTPSPNDTTTIAPTTAEPGWSAGQIAGVVVGALAGAVVIIVIVIVVWKHYKKSQQDNPPTDKKQDTEMKTSTAAKA